MRSRGLIISVLFGFPCFSQPTIHITSVELTKTEYYQCTTIQPTLVADSIFNDTMTIGTTKLRALGVFKATEIVLLKSLSDSSYSMGDQNTGWMENLLGFPVFSSDLKIFGCFGPAFGHEWIKLYQITPEGFKILCGFPNPKKIAEINCLSETSFYAKEADGRYLKFSLEIRK